MRIQFFGLLAGISLIAPAFALTILVTCDPNKEPCKTCYQFNCGSWQAQSLDRTGKKLPASCVLMQNADGTAATKDCKEQTVGIWHGPVRATK